MKNAKLLFAAFLFSVSLLFSRCSADTAGLVPSTEESLVRNIWSVDYYYQNQDLTDNFSAANLVFSPTGVVAYKKGGATIGGHWTKTVLSDVEVINLQFDSNDPDIIRLSDSWRLTGRSASYIQFEQNAGASTLLRIRVN